MCGIAGFWECSGKNTDVQLEDVIVGMTNAITARGPDDIGTYIDTNAGLALGHRRLSIIDLSASGHQPMVSQNEAFVLVYNGEIYNAPDIRDELKQHGILFKGHSDSEVLLEACAHWGIDKTLPKLIGMFAFALWNIREQTLYMARDRLGIKPLYYYHANGRIMFSSQSKSFYEHPYFKGDIDPFSLSCYMRLGYVPTSNSMYSDVQQVQPGTYITIKANQAIEMATYWRVPEFSSAFDGSYNDAKEELKALLKDAVSIRMLSDVPLGGFLSGGVDSSLVVSLMQEASARPIKSFSIGFDQDAYDESSHAEAVASHLGTDHTTLQVTSREAMDIIPHIPECYDEPFADSSQIPTMLLSSLTRKHVTVALSGDGGDELFSGYNRYLYASKLQSYVSLVPYGLRALLFGGLQKIPAHAWQSLLNILPVGASVTGDRVDKLLGVLSLKRVDAIYARLISQWQEDRLPLSNDIYALKPAYDLCPKISKDMEAMQYNDLLMYLPGDILTKVDRASMHYSLEARVPLLDHRVVEFASTLPRSYRLHGNVTKRILRDVLYDYVPKPLIERPKMGFGVPLGDWLKGDLREWADDLLSEPSLRQHGFFDEKIIRHKWQELCQGERNWQYALWPVIMFQAWYKHYAR